MHDFRLSAIVAGVVSSDAFRLQGRLPEADLTSAQAVAR